LSHALAFFALVYFSGRFSCFLPRDSLGLQSSYLYLPSSWYYRYKAPHPVYFLR
jgi:hypothetical protein